MRHPPALGPIRYPLFLATIWVIAACLAIGGGSDAREAVIYAAGVTFGMLVTHWFDRRFGYV